MPKALLIACGLALAAGTAGGQDVSPIKRDEVVLFYPTFARQEDGGRTWKAAVHGTIFEPEERSLARSVLVTMLRESVPRRLSPDEEETFRRRVRLFLVDSERGKTISVRVGPAVHRVGTSGADGHFRGEIRLSDQQASGILADRRPGDRWIAFSAVTRPGDLRVFAGRVQLVAPEGLSVVSDIDDTIKVTDVRDRRELLANTFLRRFRAVPGMAAVYGSLAQGEAAFHYVSASPWQLYPALADFVGEAGFPAGTFHLKSVRLTDASVSSLFGTQEEFKTREIEGLLAAFPQRRFLLVGDSGEQDPEIFGRMARKHAEQVRAVWIRNVTRETADSPRFREAFRGLPPTQWLVFREAGELREAAQLLLGR